jgi:hypothetical protein
MTLYKTYSVLVILGASVLFAGCGGGTQMPAAGGLAPGSAPVQLPADHGRNGQRCPNDGDINVKPCRVTFDTDHPGPTDVTVTHGGRDDGDRGHRIRERDNCASRSIATITRDSNRMYTVTAGSIAGSCSARFDDNGNRNDDHGGRDGANLRIVNKL